MQHLKIKQFIMLRLLLVFALFLGAKAFAQEWEYTYSFPYSGPMIKNSFNEAYEMSDGRILVSGITRTRDNCGNFDSFEHFPCLSAFSSDGTLMSQVTYYRDGYIGNSPFVLENESGESFILLHYDPDQNTCSSNYFKNFDPPTDHSTLALHKLNEDLSIAESYERDIPIDTFRYDTTVMVTCGHLCLFSAFVDDEGYIVGGYMKTVSSDIHWRGRDSTFFFKMDFEGNMVKEVGFETSFSANMPEFWYRNYHMVQADSLYLYYGTGSDVTPQDPTNLIYFDRDFNIVRTRIYRHSQEIPHGYGDLSFVYSPTVKRSATGRTYLAAIINTNNTKSRSSSYSCTLYEYDDDIGGIGGVVPIKHFVHRKTGWWDYVADYKSVDIALDNSIYFCYTLNVGPNQELDSWIMIEHLTPDLDTITTLYYDLPGERIHTQANNILATGDGGAIVALWAYDLNDTDKRYYSIVKFGHEAFVGIDEAHANGLKVAIAYPNPGNEVLNIRTGLRNANVEVYDMTGRLMHSQRLTEEITPIDTERWPSGTYVWKVVSDTSALQSGSVTEAESGKWIKE